MPVHILFFFSSRGRHTRSYGDWSSDVCSSDLAVCDLERRAVDDPVGDRPAEQPVVRVDLPEAIGEAVLDLGGQLALPGRSEEHTSELQSPYDIVCRLLLEKKNRIL